MKRFLAVTAMLLVVCLLTACNFTTNFTDSVGMTEAESREKVEQMLQALVDGDTDAALALMHPGAVERSETPIIQMSNYLSGHTVAKMTQTGVRVNTSSGTAGKIRQEATTFQVNLDDGAEVYIAATYYENSDGAGFISFQLILGIV